jgi:N-acetylneuraminate synthase
MSLVIRRPVGTQYPPYIVAAFDGSRLSEVPAVLAAVDAAADVRCDAIKLGALPWASCVKVFDHADRRGLTVLATANDERDIERLDWMGAPAFELFLDWSDLDLVACAARTGKPVLLSVANASELDIAEAISVARSQGNGGVALIQRAMTGGASGLSRLQHHGTTLGISDRSAGSAVIRSAIRLGASIIEKRLSPRGTAELPTMVRACELAWAMQGNVDERFANVN